MIAFTAPSGAGKTTIVRHLLEKYSDIFSFSISATTRARRENETHGKDYYFLSNEEFKSRIEAGDFIEWEEVYEDKYYGTLKSEVERINNEGKKVIFDIEINGAQNLKMAYDERVLIIYVKPPSFRTLVNRLINRKSESPQSLEDRVKRIKTELLFEHSFDMVLLNDKLEETLENAENIIEEKVLKQLSVK
ncbi:MAG: guanylate kinase [Saprospiraceae bacterium]|nr:guanylate kinase [Bacteroidia bacterium]MBT8230337.1 guanylate kinase [Bacteroidia bacterium]NNF21703.1 guanylate kinase [Saprospiraceae bacterium]NNK89262.1 guanylate kinase [Saprospiraceae bacterium]